MSAKSSVIIQQTSAFVILLAETSFYYSAIFVVGMQGLALPPESRKVLSPKDNK